jgi:hypothetical protein
MTQEWGWFALGAIVGVMVLTAVASVLANRREQKAAESKAKEEMFSRIIKLESEHDQLSVVVTGRRVFWKDWTVLEYPSLALESQHKYLKERVDALENAKKGGK